MVKVFVEDNKEAMEEASAEAEKLREKQGPGGDDEEEEEATVIPCQVGSSACVASDVASPGPAEVSWKSLERDSKAWGDHDPDASPPSSAGSAAGSAAQGPTVAPQPSPAGGDEEDGGEAVKYHSWEFFPPP